MPVATEAEHKSSSATSIETNSPAGVTAPQLQLDHLGLIVADLAMGRDQLRGILGITRWTAPVEDVVLGVAVQFGAASQGGLVYELVAPHGETSPIANALRSGKHILNHLAYLTPDLDSTAEHLRAQGCYPAGDPQPAIAYGGARVQFWMSPLRFVLELIEKPGHSHAFLDFEDIIAGDSNGGPHS